jgi:4-hydroxy-3-polyprenylbenzoate decarboxylase
VVKLNKKIVVALCGASGMIYAIRLLRALLEKPLSVHLIISEAGREVLKHETDYTSGSFSAFLKDQAVQFHENARLIEHDPKNLFAAPASGSFRHAGMVIAPCSMKTLGAIAGGIADSLVNRAADVSLKEKRPLILLVRETPLSVIHLKNMHTAALSGATIMPASPGFYAHPRTLFDLVDSVVARILDHLSIEQDLMGQWGDQDDV